MADSTRETASILNIIYIFIWEDFVEIFSIEHAIFQEIVFQ